MKQLSGIIFVLLLTSHVFTQDTLMSILDQRFKAYELNSDLVFIRNKAEFKYNKDGFLFVGKDRFYRLYDSIEKVITESGEMSRLEFYKLTAPLIRCLKDDGSFFGLEGDYVYDKSEKRFLPFSEKIVIPLFIVVYNDTAFMVSDVEELNHAQIISINNIPINQIVSDVFWYTSSCRDSYFRDLLQGNMTLNNYPLLLYALYGFKDEVEIIYIPREADMPGSKRIELLALGDDSFFRWFEQMNARPLSHGTILDMEYPVLRIGQIDGSEIDLFELNDLFGRIHDLQSKALIIDVSSCFGSHSSFWILFLNYLSDGDLYFHSQKDRNDLAKLSKEHIKKYKKNIIGKYKDIDQSVRYKGDVYLLVGAGTWGGVIVFADVLRYNKLSVRIYGEETRTGTTLYVNTNDYTLPITRLRLGLSTYLRQGLDKDARYSRLKPDVVIKPNSTAEFWDNRYHNLIIKRVIEDIQANSEQ